MESAEWLCPICGDVRDFEQPPCVDGHTAEGDECPEWICVDCGTAFLLGEAAVVAGTLLYRAA